MSSNALLQGQVRCTSLLALGALLVFAACRRDAAKPAPVERTAEAEGRRPAPANAPAAERVELLSRLDGCEVDHRGAFLDLGTEGVQGTRRFSVTPLSEGSGVVRDGMTFERVTSRELALDVWLDAPIARPTLSLRAHGGTARLVHLFVDDQRFGVLRLPNAETRILATAPGSAALAPGRHRVVLRFSGAPRASKAPLVDIDWLRVGEHDERPGAYAAPTREDIVTDVALDKVPRHSLVLRAKSTVRCWLRPSEDARLKVALGLWGSGNGVAEIRLLRDGEPPVVLQTRKLSGGDGATWVPITADLAPYARGVVGLEFTALEATRGGRVAFGDPVLVRREEPAESAPQGRLAVVVVLSSADRRRIPPLGPKGSLRTLAELSRISSAWTLHRAPTSVAGGVLGTLITGLAPRAHGLEDAGSRLAPELHTLPEIVKEAGGRAAMFTGVPTSFAPFGFEQGWDVFEAVSPVKDFPASEPLQRAAHWLEREVEDGGGAPIVTLIHSRGAHPPWDITREEAQHLKPAEYSGAIDPRRGGIIIASLRERRQRSTRRLLDDDWTRLRALGDAALVKQDAALGQLVSILKRKNVWDRTLLVVTSDVAPGDPPEYPFDPKGGLTDDRLLIPLLIKFPDNQLGGKEFQRPTTVEDVTYTVLTALGLKPPPALLGLDLHARGVGREPLPGRAQVATLPGRYATRLGQWLLRGDVGAVPTLCAVDVDPACATDVFNRELVAARALWQATFAAEVAARRVTPVEASRRPVVLDPETSAALVVWGDQL